MRNDNYRTNLERRVSLALDSIGIGYREQAPLRVGFIPDFIVETSRGKIIIEADGPTHATPEGRKRDGFRDKCLRDAGWKEIHHLPQEIILDEERLVGKLREIIG